jgi:hypothetical protein
VIEGAACSRDAAHGGADGVTDIPLYSCSFHFRFLS